MEGEGRRNQDISKGRKLSKFWILCIAFAILGIIAFEPVLLEGFLGAINPPVETRKIRITKSIDLDLVGAVLPTVAALLSFSFVLIKRKLAIRRYSMILSLSTSLALIVYGIRALFLGVNEGAIIIMYNVHAFAVGMITFLFLSYKGNLRRILRSSLREFAVHEWSMSGLDILVLFLVGYSCSTLSVLALDLFYALGYTLYSLLIPRFSFQLYIGGAGTVDGILVSGVFVFLPLAFLVSLVNSKLLKRVLI